MIFNCDSEEFHFETLHLLLLLQHSARGQCAGLLLILQQTDLDK
jgi:hypothetical protein